MWFDLFSFLYSLSCPVGLVAYSMKSPPSTVWSGRNIMQMHLFLDYTLVLFAVSFIPVMFTDHFGSFRCLWTDTYRGQNGSLFFMEPYKYIGRVCCILFKESGSQQPHWSGWSGICSFSQQDPSLTFYYKITHNYQLLNMCCLQQAHLHLFLLIST